MAFLKPIITDNFEDNAFHVCQSKCFWRPYSPICGAKARLSTGHRVSLVMDKKTSSGRFIIYPSRVDHIWGNLVGWVQDLNIVNCAGSSMIMIVLWSLATQNCITKILQIFNKCILWIGASFRWMERCERWLFLYGNVVKTHAQEVAITMSMVTYDWFCLQDNV